MPIHEPQKKVNVLRYLNNHPSGSRPLHHAKTASEPQNTPNRRPTPHETNKSKQSQKIAPNKEEDIPISAAEAVMLKVEPSDVQVATRLAQSVPPNVPPRSAPVPHQLYSYSMDSTEHHDVRAPWRRQVALYLMDLRSST
jgi:hypothetical protein